jgi:hypothetical protein
MFTPYTKVIPSPSSYPVKMSSPLLRSGLSFQDLMSFLSITREIAVVLDDMRFLTTLVISGRDIQTDGEEHKICKTAKWLHERILELPPINNESQIIEDCIYECCRIAAKVYTTSISTRKPMSQSCSIQEILHFWRIMPRVPLSRWKSISGIFLWICAVLCPGAEWTIVGRFLKSLVSNLITDIGLNDWNVMVGCIEGLLAVHSWLK